ncbi:hypothetical protein FE782_00420 [Paenibacillus antri]|uniref:Phospholipase C/D domain-containing protein n=1 Tax=Paenibacillus antri TaxID=2582848 RepID=A0A5R9GHY0_9BACL|nr:hypothetical protein [Paenibacillus antri]TLS53860.1 hypothetical protein FE782_00420 [Paenibacillus antri]
MVIQLTRTALIEDSAAILLATDGVSEALAEAAGEHAAFLQFGALRSADDAFALPYLDRYRLHWDTYKTVREDVGFRSAPLATKTEAESVLALALGWLAHRVADRRLSASSEEADLYRDAYLFRARYAAPDATLDAVALSELFEVLKQRYFIEMHTFKPDGDDIEGWFDALYAGMQEWDAYMDRFAKAVAEPDADGERRHVLETNFYRADDAIVALASRLRNGGTTTAEEREAALAAVPASRYGQALRAAVGHLLHANAFFARRVDELALEASN